MNKKNLLLIMIVLLIAIVCILMLIMNLDTKNNEEPIQENYTEGIIEKVTDRDIFYMVENSVNTFYKYYFSSNRETGDNSSILYNLLDEKYIKFKNITKENLYTIVPSKDISKVNVYDIYVSKQSEDISIYIAEGVLRENDNNLSDFQIMIKTDSKNKTFSILLQDYIMAYHRNVSEGQNLKIDELNSIKRNRDNIYVLEEISDNTYVQDLFNRFKEELLYNTQLLYKHLDEEYRNNKYPKLEEFQEYITNRKEQNIHIKIKKYQKAEYNDYTQYVGIGEYGEYYIFRETGTMNYTILLDTYTVDLPEFLQKYNEANSINKVGYNIQKCIEAINNKDYNYVYNKLDFEFKANNYNNLKVFEDKLTNNLFDKNEIKSVSIYYEGDVYIYKLKILNQKDTSQEKNMTVIMKLKEGTDFVMSFSFEE